MPASPAPSSPLFSLDHPSPGSRTGSDDDEMLDTVDLNADPAPEDDPWRTVPLAAATPSVAGASSRDSGASFRTDTTQRLSRAVSTPATEFTPTTEEEGKDIDVAGIEEGETPMVLGVAVIGPTVEFAHPASLQDALANDEDLSRLLPFLALPDGAHLSEEDYSFFHCTYSPSDSRVHTNVPSSQTLFGISCNRQLASTELLKRPSDVTRSMVQKAVIVVASKPVFGPIRDRLGVVTRAYFAQRDFTHTQILEDFYHSLETSLQGKSGEEAIYMGTSLRELVHKFRHRTLILLKLLMLQKRIMLFGYPVDKLCTYQYSLVSLIPGLLMDLYESGRPELEKEMKKARPTSLRTSDRASLLRFMGLPLRVFGNGAFFQPYMPLQEIDKLKCKSWLVGTTNQIVTQQKDCKYDLLVNIDNNTFEFTDPKLEKTVGLTPADRKWMDDVVQTVEESWNLPEGERPSFRGSDDDLRARFEEYILSALSSIKYADFLTKGKASDISIIAETAGAPGSEGNVIQDFSEQWIIAFKETDVYEKWNGMTDPVLFDIHEPKHPCEGKAGVVSDIGLRLAEGLHDLHLDQQLAPTREVLSSAFQAGSQSIFKAFDGVRSEVDRRMKEREEQARARGAASPGASGNSTPTAKPGTPTGQDLKSTIGGIGSGIGSFFGSKVASFRAPPKDESPKGLRPMSLVGSVSSSSPKAMARSGESVPSSISRPSSTSR
ncbi:hypothetical protein L198_04694 [Cryptococcus wingfieldii CBS 7118]|uniref:UDENN domain-containing protein n=1 Tax=Cryptococcus wingfieldii CBS 7118 TaxID=1295528 RepID=A0A1E3J5S7_9TREE|nr:hypothetical protein L198_04694 [Cryptococcus wingfieldii CBS 7118]ODN95301.1 hypothetical protein L198_04694 [Cryptococcus wingfieldii CBS 7118]